MAARYCEKCDEAWPVEWPRCPVHETRSELHRRARPTLTVPEAKRRANYAAFERHYIETRGVHPDSDLPPLSPEERALAAAAAARG